MRPYDIECMVIAEVLRYGEKASRLVLPQLGPDKFIFGTNGEFGVDHCAIWGGIMDVALTQRRPPTFANVSEYMPEYVTALRSLMDRLEHQYHLHTFDPNDFQSRAGLVDKQGVVYNMAHVGGQLATYATDTDVFMSTTRSIKDIEQWATEQLTQFREVVSTQSSGYVHVSTVVDALKEKWDRQLAGEELLIVPCGIPAIRGANLFPQRKMSVVHGLSSSGKSTLVFTINLGTAIQLYAENIPGCVAINSLEMEQEDLVERMCAILAHVNVGKFMAGTISKPDVDKLKEWADFVAKLPIYIDDTNFITTTAMEYRASGLHVSKHGPVIQLSSDYGELFRDTEGKSEEQRVSRVFRNQFNLSRLIGASVIAISQSTPDSSLGKSYIAGPDGTRYSKAILHAADVTAELWNPPQAEAAGRTVVAPEGFSTAHPWLFVQKFRGGEAGVAVPLGWRAETTTFFDMNMDQTPGKEIVFTHLQKALDKDKGVW